MKEIIDEFGMVMIVLMIAIPVISLVTFMLGFITGGII